MIINESKYVTNFDTEGEAKEYYEELGMTYKGHPTSTGFHVDSYEEIDKDE